MREGWPFDRDDGRETAPTDDGSTTGRGDGGPRVRSGSRPVLRALGITAVTTTSALGVLGLGALVVSGLGGLDVVLTGAREPAEASAPAGSAGSQGSSELGDDYLASLAEEEPTPPPPPPDAVEPADVPEPVVRVVPLAPGESFAEDDHPWAVAYEVPDTGARWSEALPEGLLPLGDIGQHRSQPTVPGQSCNGPSSAAVAGRQWMWAEEDSNRLDQTSVSLVVTGWPTGTGPAAFADVRQDDGPCSWLDDVPVEVDVHVPSGDEDWAGVRASPTGDGSEVLLGAARTGDLVVGVEVRPPGDGSAELVGELLEAAVVELREADPGSAAG